MSNHFSTVKIKHFKSIKEIKFACRRINLFIGEPNVGKSNILEALALFSAPSSFANGKPGKDQDHYFGWDQIRYEKISNLFHFQDITKPLSVVTNKGLAHLILTLPQSEQYEFFIAGSEEELELFMLSEPEFPFKKNAENFYKNSEKGYLPNYYIYMANDGKHEHQPLDLSMLNYRGFVKKYVFNQTLFNLQREYNRFPFYLLPSYGSNIFTIVHRNRELEDIVAGLFEKYGLELVFVQDKVEYLFQYKKGRIASQLPYDSAADTLQRYIFHLAAIHSNKDSVLLFEEPEAHTFPTYIIDIAQEIIDSETNQFFISSHSPYLVERIIEKAPAEDVSVFFCQYKDHQTTVRELTSAELSDMKKYKFDIIAHVDEFEK